MITAYDQMITRCYQQDKRSNGDQRTVFKLRESGSGFTKFFPSKGTPNVLVVRESLVVEGETENLIMSPKLITCVQLLKVPQLLYAGDPLSSSVLKPRHLIH